MIELPSRRVLRVVLVVIAALAIVVFDNDRASANPLELARFGGLRGDPTFDGAFAMYWNPAALAQPGFDVALDGQLAARQASYDRDAELNMIPAALRAANSGLATINTVGVIPGIAGRYGRSFPHVDVGVGLGSFVETGGAASWDKNLAAPPQYPGAIDGPQRWSSISSSLVVVDLAFSLAVRHRATGLSFGVTPILALGSFATTRARNIDGSEDLVDSSGNLKEGRVAFDGNGQGFSCIFGARWDINPRATVAATYQVGAQLHFNGTLRVAFGTQAPSSEQAQITLPVADTMRLAASLALTKWLTLRPMFQWSRWSVLQQHVFEAADGTPLDTIPRDFGDGYSGNLRADARIGERFRVTVGGGLEHGPTPSKTMEPGFGEGDSMNVGAGAMVAFTHYVDLSASVVFQYFFPWTVTDSIQQPLTNGTYRDEREFVLVDLEFHEWRATLR